MQQPTSQEVVSSSFLLDIFDRFISKTFENDTNYSFLSKEWNNFKPILSKGSLDLEQIFRHLAQLQLNIDQFVKNPENAPVDERSNTEQPLAIASESRSASTQASPMLPKLPQGGLDSVVSPTLRTESLYSSPTTLGRNFGTAASYHSRQNTIMSNLNSTSGASTKIPMAFLAEKAKSLKQNIQGHTDKLTEKVNRPALTERQEERSQLRNIVVYAKPQNLQEMARNLDVKVSNRKNKDQKETFLFC